MFRKAGFVALIAWASLAYGEENAAPAAPLTSEEVTAAVFADNFSIPNASEFFAAIDKLGRFDWTTCFRRPPAAAFVSRPQIALNIGVLIADGMLAAEAQEKQQVKNVAREIKQLTKSLGLEPEFVGRNNSLADLAENRRWDALDEELEAVQNELAAAMTAKRDNDLVMFMALGCWLRSIEIATTHLAANYSPEGARILRQPAVTRYFSTCVDSVYNRGKAAPVVIELQRALPPIGTALSFPENEPPAVAAVEDLRNRTTALLNLITEAAK